MEFDKWWELCSKGLDKSGWWNFNQVKLLAEFVWDSAMEIALEENGEGFTIEDTKCWCYGNCDCRNYDILRPDGTLYVDVNNLELAKEITRALNIQHGYGDFVKYTETRESACYPSSDEV